MGISAFIQMPKSCTLSEGRTNFVQMAASKVFLNNEDHVCEALHPAIALTQSPEGICVYPCCSNVGSPEILVLILYFLVLL